MSSDKDTVDAVEKLLSERRKITGWINGLAARQASTPPAVYQRVFDDYSAKLQKVQAKLTAASDSVQVAAADVAARLTDKEEALSLKRDERAEAELRAAVGEFSEREWEKRRTRLDDEMGALTGERDTLRDELARLRAVLDDVAAKGEAAESPVAAEADSADDTASAAEVPPPSAEPLIETPSASPFAAFEEAISAELAIAPPIETPAVGMEAVSNDIAAVDEPLHEEPQVLAAEALDEPEPVRAASAPTPVVGIEPPAAPVIPIHEQSVIAPVEETPPLAPSFDELAFLKSVVGRATPAKPVTTPRRTPPKPMPAIIDENAESKGPRESRAYEMPEPPTPFPDPVPEPRVSQEMTPPRESFFGRPTPRTSEAIKSLRCQECGTLNYPTEWYCERCGGELAAL